MLDSSERGTEKWLSSVNREDELSDYDRRLAVGAAIVEEMRKAVFTQTGFRCSAGIAANKVTQLNDSNCLS